MYYLEYLTNLCEGRVNAARKDERWQIIWNLIQMAYDRGKRDAKSEIRDVLGIQDPPSPSWDD